MANPDDDITVEVGVAVDKKDIAEAKAAMKALTEALDKQFKLDQKRLKIEEDLRKKAKDAREELDRKTASQKRAADQTKKLNDRLNGYRYTLNKITKITKTFGSFVKKYVTGSLQALQKLLMPAAISLAALGAGFLAAKVAVVGADLALKAWNVTLKALPAAAAVGLGAVAALTAAVAEIQAAANLPFYREAGGETQQGLAGIYNSLLGDPQTALLGAQSISATTNSLMQAKVPLQQIRKTVEGLGGLSFYAGGGDAAAGLQNIVGAITEISKDKNARMSAQELERLAASFGPMSDKIKEVGKEYVGKDFQEFVSFLSSSPEELAGFTDGLDAANGTLIGMAKSIKGMAQAALKPFGDQIIGLTKGPLGEFKETMLTFINGVMPSVVVFFSRMLPSVFNGLSSGLDRLGEFMRESLPGMVDGFKEGVGTVRNFFQGTGRVLREFYPYLERVSEGFDILFDTILGPILGGITRMFGGALMELTSFFERNEEAMANIGSTVAGLFSMDSWLMNTIKSAFQAVGTLIETLGPQILKMIDYLEAPFYLFDIINNNKSALDELGKGLEYFIEKAFGPFFDFVVRIIEFVVESGPDIADIFRAAADVLDPMISLANTLLDVLEALGGIKTIFAFLIGKKVLTGIMALGNAFGVAGMKGGFLATMFGGGPGMGRMVGLGGLGMAAGAGLTAYGMSTGNEAMAAAGPLIGGLGAAATIMGLAAATGSTGVGAPIAAGLTLIAAGYGSYQAYQSTRRANEATAGERGMDFFRMYEQSPNIQFGSSYHALQYRRRLADQRMDGTPRSFFIGNDLRRFQRTGLTGDMELENAARSFLNAELRDIDAAAGTTELLAQYGVFDDPIRSTLSVEQQISNLDGEDKAALRTAFIDRASSTTGFLDENVQALEAMNTNLGFMTDKLNMTEREATALADALGLDLSTAIDESTMAFGYLQEQLSEMKTVGEIFSSAFDEYVYAPLRAMQHEAEVQSIGEILQSALDDGMVFTDDKNPIQEFVMRSVEFIPRNIERRLGSGEINTEQAIAELNREFDVARQGVTSVSILNALDLYEKEIEKAILAGDAEVTTQADRIATELERVANALGEDVSTVIEAVGSKTAEALEKLGFELPGQTNDGSPGSIGGPPNISEDEDGLGDTYSPKAALLQTLGTHSMVDSMIAGNRTITSAWRDHSLGSPNSDHITGRALDITGDNLGAYASAIRSMGGFAELHGSGASRHLHVVPPIGDTAVAQAPMIASVSRGGGGVAVSNHNNIVVNPSAGMNEQALAQSVVREISRMNRESMERM